MKGSAMGTLITALCLAVIASADLADVFLRDLPLQNPDLFGGDMIVNDPFDRAAVPNDNQRWPAGVIPYVIDPSVSGYRILIQKAMTHYHEKTCIRFKERTSEYKYIRIFAGQGCYAEVGMSLTGGGGPQPVSLGSGCMVHGIIIHELGHAVGFYHEHMRSDRDLYINIIWENIGDGLEGQFIKMSPWQHRLLDMFDFNSIMLYGETSFSKDGILPTMTPRQGGFRMREVHEKDGLSQSDINRIKKLYRC